MSATTAVPTADVTDSTIPERAVRALNEYQTVFTCGGGIFEVYGEGSAYRIDLREGRCTCPNHQYEGGTCKHQWRCAFAVGLADIPDHIEPSGDLRVHNGANQ